MSTTASLVTFHVRTSPSSPAVTATPWERAGGQPYHAFFVFLFFFFCFFSPSPSQGNAIARTSKLQTRDGRSGVDPLSLGWSNLCGGVVGVLGGYELVAFVFLHSVVVLILIHDSWWVACAGRAVVAFVRLQVLLRLLQSGRRRAGVVTEVWLLLHEFRGTVVRGGGAGGVLGVWCFLH